VRLIVEFFDEIEKKWRQKWVDERAFEADPNSKKKWFANAAFPYVNAPLHLGHAFTYTRVDVSVRFKRMQGFNTFFPFAFHATGEPIVGVAKRLESGDETQKKILLSSGISEKNLTKFKDPKFIVQYWKERIKDDISSLGIAVDWRRAFTTIDPDFNRFISWQYRLLKDKGFVKQGTHPVVWCHSCQSPTGDHDRLEGEGEGPTDYVVLKFKMDSGDIIPMATLRPETIYGVTNVWVNPKIKYVRAEVNGEKWIIAPEAVKKLKDQGYSVQEKGKVDVKELIGKFAENPVLKNKVIILPAELVDAENTTGIVVSVPSHAPYDWIGLKDLYDADLSEYGIEGGTVGKIEPISLIETKNLGEHPAVEMCEEFGVKDQNDVEKLDKATHQLYKKEFHVGVLNDKCGEYKGMRVSQCKDDLIKDFVDKGFASKMWEPTGKVVCRCGTRCYIKILENQWFLSFSDERWKQKVRQCMRNMVFYPERGRKQFEDVVEWLQDKACARKSGLGTRVPWDQDWIVETLSDSVIYMAYYTIANHIKENIKSDQLNDDVFDFVLLGKGDVDGIAKETSISKQLLQKMQEEFNYWYPFDVRGSAKELIPNHLTFCIFHHTAIFPENQWPKGFTVNGMLNIEGKKMSKSKGNFILMKEAVEKYGADATRLTLMASGETLDDVNWTEKDAFSWGTKMKSVLGAVDKYYNKGVEREKTDIDLWIESQFQNHIKSATGHLEKLENRSGLSCFHRMFNDFQWYCRRTEPNKQTANYALESIIKILTPFAPFTAEEGWNKMGQKGFALMSAWPKFDEKKINKEISQMEEAFKKTCEDVQQVIKLSGKNKNLYLYVTNEKEKEHFSQAKEFLKRYGFEKVEVFAAGDSEKYDPKDKSKKAKFGKPGIFVE